MDNKDLLRVPNLEVDELTTAVNPDYADAVNEHEKIKDKLEDDFKEQEKEKEAFIKDSERREIKFSAPKQFKQMKLSEALFEDVKVESPSVDDEEIVNMEEETPTETLTEAINFGDPRDMGRGACTPNVANYTKAIQQAVEALDDERTRNMAIKQLTHHIAYLLEITEEVEAFNTYWTERYSTCLDFIDSMTKLIPSDVYEQLTGAKNESLIDLDMPISANVTANGNTVPFLNGTSATEELEEAVAVADDIYIYKKKRMPLADILMAELCEGEYPVYRKSASGKLNPTNGPHFNLDYDDVAAGYDGKGDYIIAWVADEQLANKVATLGDKYNRETVIGSDKYVSGTPFFVKIYVEDDDWETPYVDPNVTVR